jgi:Ca2+-binding RTX toxin-like protein
MTATIKYHYGSPDVFYPWDAVYDAADNGEFLPATTTKLILAGDEDGRMVFTGNFTVSNGVVTGGTITGFTVKLGTLDLFTGTGYSIDAVKLIEAVKDYQNDDDPFWDLIYNIPLVQQGTGQDDEMWGNDASGTLIAGGGNDKVWGYDGNETIKGNGGHDILSGGWGADKLYGGDGRDAFFFDDDNAIDRVMDFDVKKDKIVLDGYEFEALGNFVGANEFTTGAQTNAHHMLIYNKQTGALSYDSDGNGGTDPVQFAQLSAGLNLTSHNFVIWDD